MPTTGISDVDYAVNFQDFLNDRKKEQPFCFWYGSHEPHRKYEEGSGLKAGQTLESADVPGILPDCKEVRSDLLDCGREIDWFDLHLCKMIEMLEKRGELANTLTVVTSYNWRRRRHTPVASSAASTA